MQCQLIRLYKVVVELNGKPVNMEIDTGASVSLISKATKNNLFPTVELAKTGMSLRTYTAVPIQVLGRLRVKVRYKSYVGWHDLYVVEGVGPSLLGRDWLTKVKLDWAEVRAISSMNIGKEVERLATKYSQVFEPGPGVMKHLKAHLALKPNATPRFCRQRAVPYAIKEQVGQELDRLVQVGVLRKVDRAEWAAPIVPVPKRDGTLRLCGDYKVTINPHLQVDQHPLPKPADLMACLTGGRKFTKLDLTSAYQQMELDEESAKLVTINTHQGLYESTRLPFGVASAPAIFQRAMDMVLQGIPHCICYLDDILITGVSDVEHLRNLEEVLRRLQDHGIRVKKEKCHFIQDSVEYLGHHVDARGIHTSERKVQAIVDAPAPRNLQELRSFLGLLNYYAKFIPNLASMLHPLHTLLRADQPWKWSDQCQTAFKEAKESLSRAPVLVHYDPALPLVLAADASAYGVGAVVSHRFPNGSEQPIAYASRTLSQSERNYAQIEKEALSLVFGIKKFHQYLYGRHFILMTDHKPLTSILGPKQGIPPLAAARMQRWALLLSAYTYDIKFRSTKMHANADGLSRLPLPDDLPVGNAPDPAIFNMSQLESLPIQAQEVAAATAADPVLHKVLMALRTGWPGVVPTPLLPFWRRKEDLSVEGNSILWGCRVIVPEKLRKKVLSELHQGHPGVVRMKTLARSHVWWPGLDTAIEEQAKSCASCQASKNLPAKAPLHSWAWPTAPWERVHVDYAGPFLGKMIFIAVDAHSKWPEACIMNSTTAAKTITTLREMFARYGIPRQLVSDNGPQFVSGEFRQFMLVNGVKHIRSSPYHPASNGAAERLVQTVKQALRSGHQAGHSLEQSLQTFLLRYRITPHATTGVSPCALMFGRDLRTRLHQLTPDIGAHVREQQVRQKDQHDRHSHRREFCIGQAVWSRNFRAGPSWVKAVISDLLGPVTYLVRLENGDYWRRHIDHLRVGTEHPPAEDSQEEFADPLPDVDVSPSRSNTENSPALADQHVPPHTSKTTHKETTSTPTEGTTRRYPSRTRQPPDRLYGTMN